MSHKLIIFIHIITITIAVSWGVELDSNYTPEDARDAMVRCFAEANGEFIAKAAGVELPENQEEGRKKNEELTRGFVYRAFTETGGNYDTPTKNSILAALERLKQYARNLQDPKMKSKHESEMRTLASISIRASFGHRLTLRQTQTGGFSGKYEA